MSVYAYHQPQDVPRTPRTPRTLDGVSLLSRASPTFDSDKSFSTAKYEPQPEIHGWPNQPHTLSKSTTEFCLNVAIEVFLIIISLPLLALAIAIVHYKDKEVVESEWETLRQIINSVSTAFPYVFGLVVGRAMKLFGAWRLEHGVSLGVLEQIMGSTTLGGTLTTHTLLRPLNWPTLGLFTLWVFSPIGSRTTLGLIEPRYQPIFSNGTVEYLDSAQRSKLYSDAAGDETEVLAGPINSLYSSSLMSPDSIKTSSMDQWGNVKIPYFSRLDGNITANATGWKNIPKDTSVLYSSLIGIPLAPSPNPGNTTFTITTTYLDLDCFNITRGPPITLGVEQPDGNTWTGLNNQNTSTFFIALDGFITPNKSLESPTHSVTSFLNATNSSSIPHTLLFQSAIWPDDPTAPVDYTLATCTLSQIYVDASISCSSTSTSTGSGQDCQVSAIRPTTAPHAAPSFTVLGFSYLFAMISYLLPPATGESAAGGVVRQSTATEIYLSNPNTTPSSHLTFVDLSIVPKSDFEARLGQVLNTYYLATLAPYGMTGNLPNGNASTITTAAAETRWVNRYTVHVKWLAMYFIACAVLLSGVVCGLVLKAIVVAPELLGFVSSLTRDNPYVRVPGGATALAGWRRSRLLRDVKVRLGDVRAGGGVGYIAVGSSEDVRGLEKGRSYS